MLANYGYSDGSGSYFITIDTEKCHGCGDCVTGCPAAVLAIVNEDPNDPLNEKPVTVVVHEKKRKLKYECGPCKPTSGRHTLPCVVACTSRAIFHSW